MGQAELFYRAGKSNQVSKIYEADAGLARFLPSWLGHARWADAHHLLTWLETRHALVLTARFILLQTRR